MTTIRFPMSSLLILTPGSKGGYTWNEEELGRIAAEHGLTFEEFIHGLTSAKLGRNIKFIRRGVDLNG